MRTLGELLYLRPGELARAWPFFALYLLLFAAFTVADGASVALFVTRVGAGQLPAYYAATAAANLVFIGGYVRLAERSARAAAFYPILGGSAATAAAAWVAIRWLHGGDGWYGALFVAREVGFNLMLMHFGTYLQVYFTRDELDRVLPVTYAGGRVGGIAGGYALEQLSGPLGPLDLVPVFAGLCGVGLVAAAVISARTPVAHGPEDNRSDPGAVGRVPEEAATRSAGGFLRFAWASPLLFWATITSVLYMAGRWFLNYRYSQFFEAHFADGAALAEFLGRYTQWALVLAMAVQLLAVGRLVARIGVGGTYLVLAVLVGAATAASTLPMTLGLAVFCRLVETELRFGLRNPLNQLITNRFAKPLRVRVRAWTMGVLTPAGTAAAAAVIGGLTAAGAAGWVSWAGAAVGAAHLAAAVALYRALRRRNGEGG